MLVSELLEDLLGGPSRDRVAIALPCAVGPNAPSDPNEVTCEVLDCHLNPIPKVGPSSEKAVPRRGGL